MSQLLPKSFVKTVTTAGAPVALSSSDKVCSRFEVHFRSTNTANMYLGSVTSALSADHAPRTPNAFLCFSAGNDYNGKHHYNLKNINIDADAAGQEVVVMYEETQST